MATGSLYGNSSESIGLYGIGAASGGTYFEWFIFYDSATAPATPTGGSWSFTTNTGTTPTGWTVAPPASPTNLVWVSIAIVDSRSSAALTWSTPGLMTGSGLPVLTGSGVPSSGTGLNGQLYINTATTPQSMYNKQSGSWVQITGSTLYATAGANSNITSLTGLTGGISTPTFIQISTAGDGAQTTGKLQWDPTFGGPTIGMTGGNVNQTIGQDQFVYVYNNTGSTITKGQVVYISGSQGQRVTVALAQANADSTTISVLGLAAESIANNSSGFVASVGLVQNINTSGFADGAALWLSPTVPGGYTTTKTVAPNHLVLIGYVVKGGSVGGGSVYVFTQNGYELDELHDVLITSVADGNLLRYNSAIPAWVNVTGPTGTLVGTTDTQTLTNKTISGSSNTLTNIGNSSLTNSSVTINGSGISLGSSVTITAATPNNLIFGAGLSSTGNFNGSVTTNVTLANVGTAATYGDSGTIPVFTTNAFGQITSVSLQSVVVDSTDISGTIAIAQGGTGASSAANARVNLLPSYAGNAGEVLALNAGGTDVEWRAISGTGTVSSVAVSGGTTGLTTSGGPITAAGTITLAGTLNVANGGTGLTSLTAGYIPFGSGTSAFGSSANLFWDSVNARLGIGTSSPVTKLTIGTVGSTGASSATNQLFADYSTAAQLRVMFNNTSNYIGIGTDGGSSLIFGTAGVNAGTSPTVLATLTSSGNLGIGVTTSAWATYKALQIGSGASVFGHGTTVSEAYLASNMYYNAGNKFIGSGYAAQYGQAAGAHYWFTSTVSGTANNAITFTQAMTLGADGNLLIGTTTNTNTSKLVVNGTISQTVGGTQYLVVDQSDIGTGANEIPLNQYLGSMAYQNANSVVSIGLGAGTAALPSLYSATNTSSGLWFPAANTIAASVNGAEQLRLTTTGLGIGTSSPTVKLDVAGAISATAQITVNTADGANQIRLQTAGVTKWVNYTQSDGLRWYNTADRMTLDSSGNLGLGVTPSANWATGTRALQIGSGTALWNPGSGTQSWLLANAYYDQTDNRFEYLNAGSAGAYAIVGNSHQWHISSGATGAGNPTSFTQAMTLDASGNLLVGGTTNSGSVKIMATDGTVQTGFLPYASGSIAYTGTWTNHSFGFATNGLERARFNSTGAFVLAGGTTTANGIGITFPATQSASSDANTLDDYEEGTFTPVVSGSTTAGTGTYTLQSGWYTKVGDRVFVTIAVRWTAHTGTGNLIVTGLPFTANASATNPVIYTIYCDNLALTASYYPTALQDQGTATINLRQAPTGGGSNANIPMDTSADVYLTGNYRVA